MKEKNPCIASGCLGYCCKNIFLELTTFERRRLFPKALKIDSLKNLKHVSRDTQGVYYTPVRRKKFNCNGMVETLIVDNCPHLKKDGNCNVHKERSHAARNFKIGSQLCNEIRKNHGLPKINQIN